MDRQASSRSEARLAGLGKYFTGKPCKHGHVSERYTVSGKCCHCDSNRNEAGRDAVAKKAQKAYYERNKKAKLEKSKARYEKDKPVVLANYIKRKAREAKRLPPWFATEEQQIRGLYRFADYLRNQGHDVHIDHIVPLNGELVSGLHTMSNLQILTASDNLSKGNTFNINEKEASL